MSRGNRRGRAGWRQLLDASGQSLIEGALVLPLLMLVAMGVVELGMLLRSQHVVTTMTREGSNLISRNTTLQDARAALVTMSSSPVDFDENSRVIFSVLKRGATIGTPNYNRIILYKRYEFGAHPASSRLDTRGVGSFGPAPEYVAQNSDDDTSLQLTNAPAGLVTVPGGLIYVTEVFSRQTLITPLERLGVTVPDELYSIAYF
jgi:TadE-like protein